MEREIRESVGGGATEQMGAAQHLKQPITKFRNLANIHKYLLGDGLMYLWIR